MEIIVKREALTIDVLAEIEALGDGRPSVRKMRAALNPVIEGGVGQYNIAQLGAIVEAIMNMVSEMTNPKGAVER